MPADTKSPDTRARLLDYATRIVRVTEKMESSYARQPVAKQLLRSGTSPMAHHAEAQSAESDNDFIHKLKIALKELRESHRWLELIQSVPLIEKPENLDPLIDETDQLERIFNASIQTVQKRKQS